MSGSMFERREFLTIAGGALSLPLLARCAPVSDAHVLVTCIATDPPSMNPAISNDPVCMQAAAPIYSWLVALDRHGQASPDLATSWEMSSDRQTVVFHLRQGVRWHDGRPFTAQDVKFTIVEMLARLHPSARQAYRALESVDTPDPATVVVRFNRPNPSYLALQQALGPILPRHLWENTNFTTNPLDKAPVGTGPYRFDGYKLGQSIRYRRNPHYHFAGEPHFENAIVSIIPDAVARSAAFENGDIDCVFAGDLTANDVSRLQRLPHVGAVESAYLGTAWCAVINTRKGPLANRDVRHAMAHAINRDFMRRTIMPDGTSPMVGPLYPSSPLYDASLTDYVFDPGRANALLDTAGFRRGPDGQRFRIDLVWNSANAIVAPMSAVIVRNLQDVGVDVVSSQMETQAILQRLIDDDFDILIWSYGLGPDPDIGTERLYNSNNIKPVWTANVSGYVNHEVDRLFDEQIVAHDFVDRKEIYARLQRIIWFDLPILPLFAYASKGLYNKGRIQDIYTGVTPIYETFRETRPA